jgi:hypothetical protein
MAPLAAVTSKLLPDIEDTPAMPMPAYAEPQAHIYVSGVTEVGEPVQRWIASVPEAEFKNLDNEEMLLRLRSLPELRNLESFFDRIEISFWDEGGGTLFHGPLYPDTLPVGWYADLTGYAPRFTWR